MSDVATLPWEIQKSVSTVLFIRTSDYLRYHRRKQTVTDLPTPAENVANTNLWNANWHLTSDWRFIVFLQMSVALNKPVVGWLRWLWKEPVVTCGNWNVKQTTSQQVFRVTTFYMNTCFQSFLPLISRVVHHAVLKFSPCRNKPRPQLVRVADWYSIHALVPQRAPDAVLGLCRQYEALTNCT